MSVAAASRVRPSEFAIVNALNAEWAQLTEENPIVVGRWAARHRVWSGCSTLPEVLRRLSNDSDAALSALLTEHHDGCELAGRTVLQAMLGKVVALALCDNGATVDDYVVAMWCRIRTYPLHTRPTSIAANLALDTLKSVKSEKRWTRHVVQVRCFPQGPYLDEIHAKAQSRLLADHNRVSELTATRVIAVADQLGLLDIGTKAVLLSVYADGLSGREAADRHATSVDMIRFRCSTAVRRLSQHALQLSEAA